MSEVVQGELEIQNVYNNSWENRCKFSSSMALVGLGEKIPIR